MIFRSGKYQGYSVDEVRRMAPWYIRWVEENDHPGRIIKPLVPATWDEAF